MPEFDSLRAGRRHRAGTESRARGKKQDNTGGGGGGPPGPVDKRKPMTGVMDIGRSSNRGITSVADRELISQFDIIVTTLDYNNSTHVSNFTATLNYIRSDVANPYRNPDFKGFLYQMPYELHGGQVTSISRSGSVLTIVFQETPPGVTGTSSGLRLRGLTGSYAVYNGNYTSLSSWNSTSRTATVATTETTGPTAADTSYNGIAVAYTRGDARFDFVNTQNSWSRRLGITGRRTKWTSAFGNWDLNMTYPYSPTDSNGRTFAQYVAYFGSVTNGWGSIPGIAGFYQDNVQSIRGDTDGNGDNGDWNRDGTSESRNGNFSGTSTSVQAAHRQGVVKFPQEHRAINSAFEVIANADNDLNNTEYNQQYDIAFNESFAGSDTATCVTRVANHHTYLRGNKISWYHARSYVSRGGTGLENDAAIMRRHFCRSLCIGCDCFSFSGTDESPEYTVRYRHDEYDAPLGLPVDGPISANNGGAANRCMVRRFTNGVVIFNNSTVIGNSDTVNVAALATAHGVAGYRKIGSADIGRTPMDASFNNGANVTSIVLAGPINGVDPDGAGPGTASNSIIGEGVILLRTDT